MAEHETCAEHSGLCKEVAGLNVWMEKIDTKLEALAERAAYQNGANSTTDKKNSALNTNIGLAVIAIISLAAVIISLVK